MDTSDRHALLLAFSGMSTEIARLPMEALDWEPPDGEWGCRRIVAHVTYANDFYVMICDEAVRSGFGTVDLSRRLPGYALMVRTNDAVLSAGSADEARAMFEARFELLFAVLDELPVEDMERSFTLSLDWSNEPAHSTTLRKRVIDVAREHMIEHRAQVAQTVGRWREEGNLSS